VKRGRIELSEDSVAAFRRGSGDAMERDFGDRAELQIRIRDVRSLLAVGQ
jgi:hypothetical protein